MSFIGKEYVFDSQDNFDGFLRAVGLPEEGIEKILQFTPSTRLEKDGDQYTYITTTGAGAKESTFESGVEFDDTVGDNVPIKSLYTVDGNTVTQVIRGADDSGKTATFAREYSDDELVVTITATGWDGVARRYYKAA